MIEPLILMIVIQFLILTVPAMVVGYWLWRRSQKERKTLHGRPKEDSAVEAPDEKRAA